MSATGDSLVRRPFIGRFTFAGLRSFAWAHPEWWILALSLLSWGLLAARAGQPSTFGLCLLARPADPSAPIRGVAALVESGAWIPSLFGWALMVGAMMAPLSAPAARHVAFRSRWRRRHRAMAGFVGGYALAWMMAGVGALALLAAASAVVSGHGAAAGAAGLLAAALWQLTPVKRAALRACHRTVPLAPDGWRADASCLRFGVEHGGRCVASCWPLMVSPMLASDSLLVMAGVTLVGVADRSHQRPPLTLTAAALALGGVLWLAKGP